jgi:ElaA protein
VRFEWRTWTSLDVDSLYALLALRQRVFVVEQHCAYLDADGADLQAHHLLGWEEDTLRAYLRVLPSAGDRPPRIGRVLTAPEVRGTGLFRPLMHEGLRGLRERLGAVPVHIEAQAHLVRAYASLGFVVVGPEYDEDGIPHVPMRQEP